MDLWGGGKRIFQKFTYGGMDFHKVVEEMLCRCDEEEFVLTRFIILVESPILSKVLTSS
jgi:hypothetical protein